MSFLTSMTEPPAQRVVPDGSFEVASSHITAQVGAWSSPVRMSVSSMLKVWGSSIMVK
jgi:hypothetical protein